MKQEEKSAEINPKDMAAFVLEWGRIAGQGRSFIQSFELVSLLRNLKEPLGVMITEDCSFEDVERLTKFDNPEIMIRFIRSLQIFRDKMGRVYYVDVLHSLCSRATSAEHRAFCIEDLDLQMAQSILRKHRIETGLFGGNGDTKQDDNEVDDDEKGATPPIVKLKRRPSLIGGSGRGNMMKKANLIKKRSQTFLGGSKGEHQGEDTSAIVDLTDEYNTATGYTPYY